jgi:hypothetical protein
MSMELTRPRVVFPVRYKSPGILGLSSPNDEQRQQR